MRKEFEMTQEDLDGLFAASEPVLCMKIGNAYPRSPQQNANDAWASLGRKMRFDHMTVKPIGGKPERFFTAEATKQ